MICHKHKCIFIHIPKCAGSSVEKAFGAYNPKNIANYETLTGWCPKNKLLLQHATPQELLDYNYISREEWNSYYKFVIYRNSWDRAYSDYKYFYETSKILGSFSDYLRGEGSYFVKLNDSRKSFSSYEGSHLISQKKYFVLNGEKIIYDLEVDFSNLKEGLKQINTDLKLKDNFFMHHVYKSKIKLKHYSLFFNETRKKQLDNFYKEDIIFFNFKFKDKKNWLNKFLSFVFSKGLVKYKIIVNIINRSSK